MSLQNEDGVCLTCGSSLARDSAINHCARCLLALGLNREPPETSFSPRMFAGYELVEQLGRGGMGVVYKARQLSLDRIVALKMLIHSQQDSPIAVLRFQIEGEATARLSHPNIVKIFEVGECEGQCFISMAFIEGASLQERIARGEYRTGGAGHSTPGVREWQTAIVDLLLSVTRAVEYAHVRGVIHRDLKPANIVIDNRGVPYLTDFGLAKLTDSDLRPSETHASLGTPIYMSPEQTRGEPLTVATDVYSIGVILYELLAGRPPFCALTALELAREISLREPPSLRRLNPGIDRDLQTICLKCLDKDPLQRYATAGLLADDLDRWSSGRRVLGRSAGSFRKSVRWTRNNPAAAALIGSLFCVVVALLTAVYYFARTQKAEGESDKARKLSELASAAIWQTTGIHTFWTDPNDPGPIIRSDVLRYAARIDRPDPIGAVIERSRIGMLVEEKDAQSGLVSYAHLIHYLEEKLSTQSKAIRFDIRAYKKKASAMAALGRGDIEFLKIGGASFVATGARYPGIRPVVAQHPVKTGVIFARRDSGIANLSNLQGKRIALGGISSTLAIWAIHRFAESCIAPEFVRSPVSDAATDRQGAKNVNEEPMNAVLDGRCEAGVINEKVLKEANHAELVVVDKYPSSPVLWVARSDLPDEFVDAVGDALSALRDPSIFERLSDRVKSYKRVTREEIATLLQVLKEVEEVTGAPFILED